MDTLTPPLPRVLTTSNARRRIAGLAAFVLRHMRPVSPPCNDQFIADVLHGLSVIRWVAAVNGVHLTQCQQIGIE